MERFWDIGSLAICVVVMLFSPLLGVPLLIIYIAACVMRDQDINKIKKERETIMTQEETNMQKGVERLQVEINKTRAEMPQDRRRDHIELYLSKCHAPAAVKWQRDAFPEDVDYVLNKLGLIYYEDKEEVYEKYSGITVRNAIPKR